MVFGYCCIDITQTDKHLHRITLLEIHSSPLNTLAIGALSKPLFVFYKSNRMCRYSIVDLVQSVTFS